MRSPGLDRETTDAEIGTVEQGLRIIEPTVPAGGRSRGSSGQEYREVKYQIELMADMNGLSYLDRIEDAQRHMAIKSLQIDPGGLTVDEETLTIVPEFHSVNLEVITYVYQGGKKAGGGR